MDNDSSLREAAVTAMAEMFLACARRASDFDGFEDGAIAGGHYDGRGHGAGRSRPETRSSWPGRPAAPRIRDLRGGRWPPRWATSRLRGAATPAPEAPSACSTDSGSSGHVLLLCVDCFVATRSYFLPLPLVNHVFYAQSGIADGSLPHKLPKSPFNLR